MELGSFGLVWMVAMRRRGMMAMVIATAAFTSSPCGLPLSDFDIKLSSLSKHGIALQWLGKHLPGRFDMLIGILFPA
jgi:hypothetical protein